MRPTEWMENRADLNMPALTEFELWRSEQTPDPYNPVRMIQGDLKKIGTVQGALSTNPASTIDGDGRQGLSAPATITIPNPATDLRPGDQLRANGRRWRVEARPHTDINPFTGWQPTAVIHVEEITG